MRRVDTIIVHCSYTPPSMDIGAEEIRRWHVEDNGWSDIGYHFVQRRNGIWEPGRPIERAGAHAKGYNGKSIGLCMVGGMAESDKRPDCNFTAAQWDGLSPFVLALLRRFTKACVKGHRDVDPHRACPTFDAAAWAATLTAES